MRRYIALLLGLLLSGFIRSVSFSQTTSWQWLNQLPQGNILTRVKMIETDTILGIGQYNFFVKCTNGALTRMEPPG